LNYDLLDLYDLWIFALPTFPCLPFPFLPLLELSLWLFSKIIFVIQGDSYSRQSVPFLHAEHPERCETHSLSDIYD